MSQKYGTIITNVGKKLITDAIIKNKVVELVGFAVGDGEGSYYMPTPDMTKLKRQTWFGKINAVTISEKSANAIEVVAVIPSNIGGFTIREMAIFTKNGELFAICNAPDTEKVIISSGVMAEMEITMHLESVNTEAITFMVGSSLMATKRDLEKLENSKQKSITASGILKGNGSGNISAATVNDYPAASTSQKGIVQLNSSLTSTSDTLAATANAVRQAVESGKRAATFVIGTTQSGHTSSEVNYLCDGIADQREINAAIKALPSIGGKIVIREGTYNITEAIDFSKDNVMLEGMGKSSILKRGFNGGSILYVSPSRLNCTVKDMQIDGEKDTYDSDKNHGIQMSNNVNNTFISGVTIRNNSGEGISSYSGKGYNIFGNILINNNKYGINIYSGESALVVGNMCIDNGKSGIYISNNNKNSVKDNICKNNKENGIEVSRDCLISQNTCEGNGVHGVKAGTNTTITGNSCSNNLKGMHLNGNGITISGNICNNNIEDGIYLYQGNGRNSTVIGNTCIDNSVGIHLGTTGCTVTGNTCIRGTGMAADYTTDHKTIEVQGSNNLIACNNIMGKNCIDKGKDNSFANNKYN